ncbi:MlaD family protein [Vibrio sp. S4M6]|uniref:MlaD family protein n=1 Tax=Vibrio sinus TaxID=2946865 RepID=UPI002029E9C8|nr:MlaD family protein [Vibrio sinus]MCL9783121.1 MlaD family protein [Vibrio sinus]
MSSESNPVIKNSNRISPLWILPIVTIILVGWLLSKSIRDSGTTIQIQFSDAQGLIAGRTTIRYHGLEVGIVRDIVLSKDLKSIYVEADVYPEAETLLKKNTRFWLVKPTANLSGVTGLDALVSGNYIAVQPSSAESEPETKFRALDIAPTDILTRGGLNIKLNAKDLGGISIGSQILYRRIPIGEVYSYQLGKQHEDVLIRASIKPEYQHVITTDSRFWNVSGIGASVGFNGVDIHLTSMSALLAGAIAVDSPDEGSPVANGQEFKLYPDIETAGRGIPISISLPENNKISTSGAPIMYRGLQIGQITTLQLDNKKQHIVAHAAIEPAFSDMLNNNTHFILEEPRLSLYSLDNLTNLVKGNFLTIVPGKGTPSRDFIAYRHNNVDMQKNDAVIVHLTSEDAHGLDKGASILFKGLPVGSVANIKLVKDKVKLDLLINKKYAHLIKSKSRFFISNGIHIDMTESGVAISAPPLKRLIGRSISFTSEGSNKRPASYPLYASKQLAIIAKEENEGARYLNLVTDELPSLSVGSPILYRNLPVGKVVNFTLSKSGVVIRIKINHKYRHLITNDTVFWNQSGIDVEATLEQISVNAGPLKSLLLGGIAFEQIKDIDNKTGTDWKLYKGFKQIQQSGTPITLTTQSPVKLKPGANVKYQGTIIGKVTDVRPNFKNNTTTVTVTIYSRYFPHIAKKSSYFWLAKTKISPSGIENIENILGTDIYVTPGEGEKQDYFVLHSLPRLNQGITFRLQSDQKGSIKAGTPVLYRDLEVGTVTNVELGDLSDRIITTISIDKNYAYLVRKNSVFWNVSGVDVSIGLTGANLKAGTVDSLIRGGIAFSTPDNSELQPPARQDQTFYLNPAVEQSWKNWRLPIPKS